MLDSSTIARLREALRSHGLSESQIDTMLANVADMPIDRAEAVIFSSLVPASQQASAGMALVIQHGMRDAAKAAEEVHKMALVPATTPQGTRVLGIVSIAIALAAAAVLPEEDDRTPGDFLRMLAEMADRHPEHFEAVKAAYADVMAIASIQADLDRFEADDLDLDADLADLLDSEREEEDY